MHYQIGDTVLAEGPTWIHVGIVEQVTARSLVLREASKVFDTPGQTLSDVLRHGIRDTSECEYVGTVTKSLAGLDVVTYPHPVPEDAQSP